MSTNANNTASPPSTYSHAALGQPQETAAGGVGPGNSNSNGGRPRLHISHRKTPSEITPLMLEQMQLQQQIQMLQQQNEILQAQQQQYAQAGLMPATYQAMPQQAMPQQVMGMQTAPQMMGQQQQQQQQPQQQLQGLAASSHRRGRSMAGALNSGMGPPPAPSAGAAGFDGFSPPSRRTNGSVGSMAGQGASGNGGHARRHSLALHEAKTAAAQAQAARSGSPSNQAAASYPTQSGSSQAQEVDAPPQQQRGHGRSQSLATGGRPQGQPSAPPQRGSMTGSSMGNFQFPPSSEGASVERRSSGGAGYSHSRTGSRNFDGNWRASQSGPTSSQPTDPTATSFVPGHRPRPSMGSLSSVGGGYQFPAGSALMFGQQPVLSPQMLQQQQLNQMQVQRGGGAQRRSLFAPYLPQATLPALLSDGRLVSGLLRVNKKNRSDAYVSTDATDTDIYICGSKDRNRALEGDLVAVELLDVDEVWGAKREKEEKKKRKDGEEAGLQRRGSLKQRPVQKKNDDVEVEGQGILLVEEEEISDELKPMYAGHVVAVVERTPGQLFSGTLGLLRPSSAATKEKQDAERRDRGSSLYNQHAERPKIVWFKPTDKRVPLIAIPTEEAPRDFVENHQAYANRLFVASIKRWPITSLHPFGTLVEELGEMGHLDTETEALLRDSNFVSEEFSEQIGHAIPDLEITEDVRNARRDFTEEEVLTIGAAGSHDLDDGIHVKELDDSTVELGVHVADVAHFVKPNSPLDREAKKRGTAVYLVQRAVPMLPDTITRGPCSLQAGQTRLSFSILMHVDLVTGKISNTWIGKGIVKTKSALTYDDIDHALADHEDKPEPFVCSSVKLLETIASRFRGLRFEMDSSCPNQPLRLFAQLDDENVPVNVNIFEAKPSHQLIEEILMKVNSTVAEKLVSIAPSSSVLCRHLPPNPRRLESFASKLQTLGHPLDTSSSANLQKSLFSLSDADTRKALETLLIKVMQPSKYVISGAFPTDKLDHYALNLPLYTHFTGPGRRYADIIVHRQLEAALAGEAYAEDYETLSKTVEHCNGRKESAKHAQDQSVHLFLCSIIHKMSAESGLLVRDAIVINVYESAFDVLIPEFGVEKRVHCDQLPLQKAEFDKSKRLLELYWEKDVDSATFVPEDERGKMSFRARASSRAAAMAQEGDESYRRYMDFSTLCIDDESALFDDDFNAADVSTPSENPPQFKAKGIHELPPTPRQREEGALEKKLEDTSRSPLAAYLEGTSYREVNGEYIQEIRELTHVPVLLRAEVSKSPPCLTIRTVNPFAV